jgi:two-component system sensor kinase FixL
MAMGELTTAIAHELNQPLAAIMTNAQAARRFLKGGTSSQGEVEEILEDIIKDDRRAGEIIRKLRALLKGEKLDSTEIDVNDVIQEVLALIRSDMLIKRIKLETMFAEEISPVLGDRTQLQQVILNLVLNASEALTAVEKDSGKIVIATEWVDGKGIRIGVSDTGPGLDDAMLDRLFDPFFTTKKEGMGIGLAISKTIVELHGGHIQAENNKEAGATFHVFLPRAIPGETP